MTKERHQSSVIQLFTYLSTSDFFKLTAKGDNPQMSSDQESTTSFHYSLFNFSYLKKLFLFKIESGFHTVICFRQC